MRTIFVFSVMIFSILVMDSCQIKNTENLNQNIDYQGSVPYKIGKNYFINNRIDGKVPTKITRQQDFEKYFGLASFMGKDGEPTPVDFSKEFILIKDCGESYYPIDIQTKSLKKQKGILVWEYEIWTAKTEQGFITRPFQMIIVDKKFDGEVKLIQK